MSSKLQSLQVKSRVIPFHISSFRTKSDQRWTIRGSSRTICVFPLSRYVVCYMLHNWIITHEPSQNIGLSAAVVQGADILLAGWVGTLWNRRMQSPYTVYLHIYSNIYISTALSTYLQHSGIQSQSGESRDEGRSIMLPLVFRLLSAPLHLQTNTVECASKSAC